MCRSYWNKKLLHHVVDPSKEPPLSDITFSNSKSSFRQCYIVDISQNDSNILCNRDEQGPKVQAKLITLDF